MNEADEWKTVSRKRTNNNAKQKSASSSLKNKKKGQKIVKQSAENTQCYTEEDKVLVQQEIEKCMGIIRESRYYHELQIILQSTTARIQSTKVLVALGLGIFKNTYGDTITSTDLSSNTINQFVILLLIREIVNQSNDSVDRNLKLFIFEPMMTDLDYYIYNYYSIEQLDGNRKGNYPTSLFITDDEKCLFYMPHCPYRLYCNVLWANWSSLDKIIIIGNSFKSYAERRFMIHDANDTTDVVATVTEFIDEFQLWPLIPRDDKFHDKLSLESAMCDISLMHITTDAGKREKLTEKLSKVHLTTEMMEAAASEDVELL